MTEQSNWDGSSFLYTTMEEEQRKVLAERSLYAQEWFRQQDADDDNSSDDDDGGALHRVEEDDQQVSPHRSSIQQLREDLMSRQALNPTPARPIPLVQPERRVVTPISDTDGTDHQELDQIPVVPAQPYPGDDGTVVTQEFFANFEKRLLQGVDRRLAQNNEALSRRFDERNKEVFEHLEKHTKDLDDVGTLETASMSQPSTEQSFVSDHRPIIVHTHVHLDTSPTSRRGVRRMNSRDRHSSYHSRSSRGLPEDEPATSTRAENRTSIRHSDVTPVVRNNSRLYDSSGTPRFSQENLTSYRQPDATPLTGNHSSRCEASVTQHSNPKILSTETDATPLVGNHSIRYDTSDPQRFGPSDTHPGSSNTGRTYGFMTPATMLRQNSRRLSLDHGSSQISAGQTSPSPRSPVTPKTYSSLHSQHGLLTPTRVLSSAPWLPSELQETVSLPERLNMPMLPTRPSDILNQSEHVSSQRIKKNSLAHTVGHVHIPESPALDDDDSLSKAKMSAIHPRLQESEFSERIVSLRPPSRTPSSGGSAACDEDNNEKVRDSKPSPTIARLDEDRETSSPVGNGLGRLDVSPGAFAVSGLEFDDSLTETETLVPSEGNAALSAELVEADPVGATNAELLNRVNELSARLDEQNERNNAPMLAEAVVIGRRRRVRLGCVVRNTLCPWRLFRKITQ